MKTHLLHPERSHFRPREKLQPLERDLAVDLELGPLLDAMADGDEFVRAVARTILLSAPCEPDVVVHRQQVLADFLSVPGLARDLYRLAVEALEAESHVYRSIFERYPDGIIRRSTQSLQLQFDRLRHLRAMADAHSGAVRSPALRGFFDTIRDQLDPGFFDAAEAHLKHLRPYSTTLASARLAQGLKGADYTLRAPGRPEPWWRRLLAYLGLAVDPFTFRIPERDEGGHRALSELKDRALTDAANSLAQADDHIVGFFGDLRTEAAFYLGCLNLYARLTSLGEPVCVPRIAPGPDRLSFRGLYDPSLALRKGRRVVGNDLDAEPVRLLVITGANEGGKSTLLRSIGIAQLMLQAGMFAPAEAFASSLAPTVLTHFARAEDEALQSGKFDEELVRMGALAERTRPGTLLLFNESFASTNEREGSEVARQIIRALLESGARPVVVTHMYDLSDRLNRQKLPGAVFLRAERTPDGTRTYRLVPGAPETTSYGPDLYRDVFGTPETAPAGRREEGEGQG